MQKYKFLNSKIFLGVCCFLIIVGIALYFSITKGSYAQIPQNVLNTTNKDNEVIYLSDIPFQKAEVGWKTIGLDKTNDNASLIMKIDNSSAVVKKRNMGTCYIYGRV